MKAIKKLPLILTLLFINTISFSQNCGCNIQEVEGNYVQPCQQIIGTIDTVSTTNEILNAISQANSSGGNMTILIADGTYQIASTASYPYITASNVVFRSLSGNRDAVILTGAGMVSVAPLVENGFYIVGDNVTISDLTIKDVGNHGIAVVGDNLFVHNVKIQNTFEQMIKGNSAGDGADNGTVQCSLFEYPAGVGPQFYIGGLDIHQGNDWTVSDNIFKNIASPSGSLAEHAVHFWDNSADNIVERNMIVNCDRGVGFGLGSSPNDGGIIRNNMIFNDGSSQFHDVGIGLETSPNTKVYNNSIFIEYQNAIEYRFAATMNVNISNNLTNKPIKMRDNGQATLTTNYENALSNWFTNPTVGNLRLNANLPLVVDQGTSLAEVSMDIDQTLRPLSFSHDIGAHEYSPPIGLEENSNYNSIISVYPNPATNSFFIQSKKSDQSSISVCNLMGQKMISYDNVDLNSGFKIDVFNWEPGIYICRVNYKDGGLRLLRLVVSK